MKFLLKLEYCLVKEKKHCNIKDLAIITKDMGYYL